MTAFAFGHIKLSLYFCTDKKERNNILQSTIMKKLMITLMVCLPLLAGAQANTWEMPDAAETAQQGNPDAKYLEGAVPVVDGKVCFTTTIKAPGKTASQIYDIVKNELTSMTKEKNQFENSRVAMDDPTQKIIGGTYQEWLVFKSTALVLDRTRLMYHLLAEYKDGEVTLRMTRINYLYEEERTPETYKAEEWITDEYGLTKKKNKLARVSGKFRRKTIDRKDYIFKRFETLLTK